MSFRKERSQREHPTQFGELILPSLQSAIMNGLLTEKRDERALAEDVLHNLLLAFVEPLAEVIQEDNRMLTLDRDEMRAFEVKLRVFSKQHRARLVAKI
jgi:hypothetical protein